MCLQAMIETVDAHHSRTCSSLFCFILDSFLIVILFTMNQQQIDAYRLQLLTSYYQQRQQQQQQQQQQQMQNNNAANYYYNMPSSTAVQSEPSPSTMALLNGLQQQYQQEQLQQAQLSSPSPTNAILPAAVGGGMTPTSPMIGNSMQNHYQQEQVPSSPPPVEKLKKKKSFLSRKNTNREPRDPSFWSPRQARHMKKMANNSQKEAMDVSAHNNMPGGYPSSPPPPYQQQQQQQSSPPPPPPMPSPPFSLPQLPAGGYLYYCPPPQTPAAPPAAPEPDRTNTEPVSAKKQYRISATSYNPRQGQPGDRCLIM